MNLPDFEKFASSRGTTFAREAYLICSGDRAAAEDAVQEALTKAYVRWGHISGLPNPTGYVRRMVIYECLTTRRRWRRRHESHAPMVEGHVVGGFEPVEDRQMLARFSVGRAAHREPVLGPTRDDAALRARRTQRGASHRRRCLPAGRS